MAILFSENFNSFTGGFAPSPTVGQLDSDTYSITGLSDGTLAFAETGTSGDFNRGTSTGGVSTGGIYAFDKGAGDVFLGVQPGGSDFTSGEIIVKVTNTTGSAVTDLNVSYDVVSLNNADRGNSLNFSYSEDNTTYNPVAALDFITAAAADTSPAFVTTAKSTTITGLNIANNGDFYLKFAGNDVSGSGSRDEYGIDNIQVETTTSTPGVTITESGGSTDIAEGGATDTYDVVLNTAPAADVTVNITTDAQTSTDLASLTFTSTNWNTPQIVTVTAVDDAADEGSHTGTITHTVSSTDTDYNGITAASVTANITDNDGTVTPPTPSAVIINEIDADTPSTPTNDSAEFIELYDGGAGNTSLDGLVVVLYNGSSDTSYNAIDLDGLTTDASGYFVIGSSNVANVDLTEFTTNGLQNGADAVALYQANATDFPNGTAVSTTNLIDAVVYDTSNSDDAGLLPLLNASEPQVNEDVDGDAANQSLQRMPNGSGGALNTSSYLVGTPTPGAANNATGSNAGGGGSTGGGGVTVPGITKIHDIQGSGTINIQDGNTVTIQGIVVGDFQGVSATATGDSSPQLRGFFVQEEGADEDGDPTTSEGIFVFDGLNSSTAVNVGDLVTVTGLVQERNDNLAGEGLTSLNIFGSNGTVTVDTPNFTTITPTQVTLPETTDGELERYEGMLIEVNGGAGDGPMTVSQNFFLGRYGQMTLSSPDDSGTAGRLYKPTNLFDAGSAQATALADENARRILILDDGFDQNILGDNPNPVPYLPDDSDANANNIRPGSTITNLVGILDQGQINSAPFPDTNYDYRLQPTQAPVFNNITNTRTAAPDPITGRLKVGSFNVLNYFNGDGQGGGFPTSRGADTAAEFTRQRDKIIQAIVTLDADILGLMEIENDGYGTDSAIKDLVNGLNAVAGAGTYAFVDPGTSQLGTDQIAVGFIYKPSVVTAVA
ncbi:MAG: ExeM/NucH family extracellular endonuclease, partial [Cyanobacteria bacterium J06633_8]